MFLPQLTPRRASALFALCCTLVGCGSNASGDPNLPGTSSAMSSSDSSRAESSSSASAENNGADCPAPKLTDAAELPDIATLPDPFMSLSGERISGKRQWRCQRQQLYWQVQHYESGIKPPKPELVSGRVTNNSVAVTVRHNHTEVSFTAPLTLPSRGEPPYPAVIGIGASSLNNEYLADAGVAVINLNNNQIGAQSGSDSRGTGLFYDVYGSDSRSRASPSASTMLLPTGGICSA